MDFPKLASVLPGDIEECREEMRSLRREDAMLKIELTENRGNPPQQVQRQIRIRRIEIIDRVAALEATIRRLKSEEHETFMEAFFSAAHQALGESSLADVFDRLYEDHPEFEQKR